MEDDKRDGTERAELRLALVCYGGVSLAVYMHGVTKELQSLIRAARALDDGTEDRLVDEYSVGTEPAYYAALRDLDAAGRGLSVSIDIIGGTSAGGINGIALSKGLATGAMQQPLKKVWLQDGDIRALLRAPKFAGLLAQAVMTATRQVVRIFSSTSPLRGELMSKLILGALRDMDTDPREGTLVPEGGALELYVPATDLDGFDVLVPSGAGGASNRDRQNAQVFEFRSDGDHLNQFDKHYTPDLAFAARASASFPGAFAPISRESFRKDTKGICKEGLSFNTDVFHTPYPSTADADKVYFVDGGVLDNAPFDVVIKAISRRPAKSQVKRRLVYIEPDPGQQLYSDIIPTTPPKRRWLRDLRTVTKVKGSHPILGELLALRDMNCRIGEVAGIAEHQESYVGDATTLSIKKVVPSSSFAAAGPINWGTVGATQMLMSVDRGDIQKISDEMHIWARDDLGPAYATYQRLKFDAAIKRLAIDLADHFGFAAQSEEAGFIRTAIIAGAREQDFWKAQPVGPEDKDWDSELSEMLQHIDVPYRERRLFFIVAGINKLYRPEGGPPHADLDALKAKAWELWEGLPKVQSDVVAELDDELLKFLELKVADDDARDVRKNPVLTDPAWFARKYKAEFGKLFNEYSLLMKGKIKDSSALWQVFTEHTGDGWSDGDLQSLISRYLGFPLYDGIIFPTLSLTKVPQFSPIGVSRFSPDGASKLKLLDDQGEPIEKLKGIPFFHFAGFFDQESRENDYLWGRLDAAELILRLLGEVDATSDGTSEVAGINAPTMDDDEPIPHLSDAFKRVLASEKEGKDRLTKVGKLIKYLEAQVDDMDTAEKGAKAQLEQQDSAASAVPNQGSESLSV